MNKAEIQAKPNQEEIPTTVSKRGRSVNERMFKIRLSRTSNTELLPYGGSESITVRDLGRLASSTDLGIKRPTRRERKELKRRATEQLDIDAGLELTLNTELNLLEKNHQP